jgi:subtilisin-like proprotein convertase family protein
MLAYSEVQQFVISNDIVVTNKNDVRLVTLTSDVSRPNRTDVKITLAEVPSCFRILLAVLSVTKIYDFTSYYI